MNPIFIVVGAPAVGKSTTSRALAAHFPRSIHIAVDSLRDMVVSGSVMPAADWPPALVEQLALARAAAAHMALTYHAAGFTVVIDDFFHADTLADYQRAAVLPDLHKVILYPSQEEAHRRNRSRSGDSPARAYIDQGIQVVYAQINQEIDRLPGQGWHLLDTTAMTIEQVVIGILLLTGQ